MPDEKITATGEGYRDMVRRCILANCRPCTPKSRDTYLYLVVAELFDIGPQSACELCVEFNLDPHDSVMRMRADSARYLVRQHGLAKNGEAISRETGEAVGPPSEATPQELKPLPSAEV